MRCLLMTSSMFPNFSDPLPATFFVAFKFPHYKFLLPLTFKIVAIFTIDKSVSYSEKFWSYFTVKLAKFGNMPF